MTAQHLRAKYRAFRKNGWHAREAMRAARIDDQWEDLENEGLVRLRGEPDEIARFDDLAGDTFNRKANPDIQESRMVREEAAFRERIARDGVWGLIGEYFDGEAWRHADSCWGFVGDDYAGYDHEIKVETMCALNAMARSDARTTRSRQWDANP